ncbi:MAG: tRNA (adenosine(37)-N6)-dimethylallyltransferase MiaA [Gemmatimonadaceae bacterium]
MPQPLLHIIAGPTGAGKSALALALAERHGALIISADSRQIYRGFDIGTAKPTPEERRRVPHAGIDIAEPTERWSAARWAEAAQGGIASAAAQGQPVILCGGTGLWLKALLHPLAPQAPLDPARRAALGAALAPLETEALRRWVAVLDPVRAPLGRTQLLRAIEVALLTGARLSDAFADSPSAPSVRAHWLIVDPGPALHARLAARLDAMFAAGWVEEVRALMATVPADAPAWNACGYREVRELVQGHRTLEATREAVLIATRQYAKRQRTWFRHQLSATEQVLRLDPMVADAQQQAEHWFRQGASS